MREVAIFEKIEIWLQKFNFFKMKNVIFWNSTFYKQNLLFDKKSVFFKVCNDVRKICDVIKASILQVVLNFAKKEKMIWKKK